MLRKSFFITCLLMFALFAICLVSCDDDNDDSEATATITYEVGKPGPTGGYVFYDKGEYSDGWRYLEAAPADLKIVAGSLSPTVDSSTNGYSDAAAGYVFGYFRLDDKNRYVNGYEDEYFDDDCTGTEIGTGKTNTDKLVNAMGAYAYLSSSGAGTTADYAARLCYILEYEKDEVIYDDWFLPSKDELNLMYTKLHEQGLGDFEGSNKHFYWSSSEFEGNTVYAWVKDFNDGALGCNVRDDDCRVRPVRAF